MAELKKEIERISKASHMRENDVLNSLIQDCCNIISMTEFNEKSFKDTLFKVGEGFRRNPEKRISKEDSGKLLACFLDEVLNNEPFTDLLSKEFGANKNLGQFFSPKDVGDLAAKITVALSEETFDVADITGCGSGGLILGRLRQILKKHGKEGIKKAKVTAVDIDEFALKSAIVQIVFNCQLHRLPIKNLEAFRENTLLEHDVKNLMFLWRPEVNAFQELLNRGKAVS